VVSPKKSSSKETDSSPKPPFRARFGAWWNGTPVRLQDPVAAKPKSGPKSSDGDDAAARKQAIRDEARAASAAANSVPETNWSEVRRKIAQLVWGDGFNAPGGVPLATELSQPLGLDKTSSMIEIGAGMGGTTREIAASTGAYVTAWELDSDLASAGCVQAEVLGVEKKAAVHVLDLENYEFKPTFYGGALIHEVLFGIEDKETLVKAIIDSMKVDSQIVIWDLFFEDPKPESLLEEWLTGENGQAYPWSHEAARKFLADNLIDVRVANDDTEKYCAMAIDAWSDFVTQISKDPVGEDMVIPIIREVERWARRIAAMQSGELKAYRFSGIKRKPVA
jgi:hypothetical protein